jgi:hypothetical protein
MPLSSTLITILEHAQQLEELNLSGLIDKEEEVNNNAVTESKGQCQKWPKPILHSRLRALNISQSSLKEKGLLWLSLSCISLKALDVSNCPEVTDTGIYALFIHLKQLESLNISFCSQLSDIVLQALCIYNSEHKSKGSLRSVTMKECPLMTQQAIQKTMKACHFLLVHF